MPLTLDLVELPDDLVWTDEFSWTPVEQSEQYTLSGALIIDSALKQSGRTITLTGGVEAAWIERGDLKTLYAKMSDNAQMTLTLLDGRVFSVIFDHKNKPIESELILDYADPEDPDFYSLTLRLISV